MRTIARWFVVCACLCAALGATAAAGRLALRHVELDLPGAPSRVLPYDVDGDGRRDFVHLGRGRDVTIHTGQPGCHYPRRPDLSVRLEAEPEGLDLIRVEDLDGDGRADIRVTRPLETRDPDLPPPVRLDLYLSGGAS